MFRHNSTVHELIILGILHNSPMHGYELKARADVFLAGVYSVSYGSLYPKFKHLEHKGMLTAASTLTDGGQPKVIYTITNQGRGYFQHLMTQKANESFHKAWVRFKIKVLFFNQLDYEITLPIVKTFKEALLQELSTLEKSLEAQKEELLPYQKSSLINNYDLLKLKLQWVNALLR